MSIPTGIDGDAPVRAHHEIDINAPLDTVWRLPPTPTPGLAGRLTLLRRVSMGRPSRVPFSNEPVTASPSSRAFTW
jgi:hypothetical protein